ncbi:type II CAAX endopeptidase family protein [Leptolyngbya sp. PCC 6406]|uniref:type II CAAX endopeptidase family protein n=1 Tax=Leptolyngbya sp. PCC 6406 TaxID=1173264 RepID=UPI0006862AEB|nr:type II CAAX endopeptidase family protein [Leptolyngbya sp. PCC 6406]
MLATVIAVIVAVAQVGGGLLVWVGLWLPFAIPLGIKLGWQPFRPASPGQKLPLLIILYGLAPVMLWGWSRWRGTGWAELGLGNGGDLGRGIGLGWGIAIAGLLLITALRLGQGWLAPIPEETSRLGLLHRLGIALALIPLAGFLGGIEELVFRGWMQTQLQTALAPWIAAAIASSLFALAHLLWDGRAGLVQQPGLWLLGLVLVLARWLDQGQIGLAWGLTGVGCGDWPAWMRWCPLALQGRGRLG